jgi:hypothetical protein
MTHLSSSLSFSAGSFVCYTVITTFSLIRTERFITPSYHVGKRQIFLTQSTFQAKLKQKGKDTCPFPFVVSILVKRFYRPIHLDPI